MALAPTLYAQPKSRPVFQATSSTGSTPSVRLAAGQPSTAFSTRPRRAIGAVNLADEAKEPGQHPIFKTSSSSLPGTVATSSLPTTHYSEPERPILTSKFSSDNIPASTKRMATKAWLQNIASAASRTPTFSSPSSTSVGHPDPAPLLVISNPEIEHRGARVINAHLGAGARRVGKPQEAFGPHVYVPPSSPPPRMSEDSVRSFTSGSSGQSFTTSASSFSQNRQDRALPLLLLRIDSLADTAVEQLASTPVLSKQARTFRERQDSSRTDDSIQVGQSALSRPATPEVPKRPLLKSILKASTSATPVEAVHLDTIEIPVTCKERSIPPFKAVLAGSVPRYPPFLADEDRLVNLKVGDRTFATSMASICAHPSHLKDFVETSSKACTASTAHLTRQSTATPSSDSSYSEPDVRRPQMKSLRLPSQVTLHFPSSPVVAIRSARASIFEDVPSDEGEQDEDLLADVHVSSSTQYLTVPPRAGTHRLSGSSSSSENPLLSFLDTTPDEEATNPFHFAYPPSTARQASSDESQPPSLSSSPTSSAFHDGSPLTAGEMHRSLSGTRPFDTFSTRSMEITLDRSSGPYEAILHYLRDGDLPRRLKYSASTALLSGSPSEDAPSRVQEMVKSIPSLMRPTLLHFLLHPTTTELEDLRDEAAYLGLFNLETKCLVELNMLKKLLETKPTTLLNEQRKVTARRAQSPVKRIRGEAGCDRPRLGAHRQYHSEASVVQATKVDADGWI